MEDMVHVKITELATAFNRWLDDYIADPRKFQSERRMIEDFLADKTAGLESAYGRECAAHLVALVNDGRKK